MTIRVLNFVKILCVLKDLFIKQNCFFLPHGVYTVCIYRQQWGIRRVCWLPKMFNLCCQLSRLHLWPQQSVTLIVLSFLSRVNEEHVHFVARNAPKCKILTTNNFRGVYPRTAAAGGLTPSCTLPVPAHVFRPLPNIFDAPPQLIVADRQSVYEAYMSEC